MDITELERQKSKTINRHPWECSRLFAIKSIIKKHTKFDHVLDFGCGDAFLVKALMKANIAHNFTAIDSAFYPEILLNLSQETHGKIQFYNDLPQQLTPKSDLALLLDVLEHCENDKNVLQSLLNDNILREDATILITVPAFQSLYSQHDLLLGHHRRYNIQTLKALCQSVQLNIVESGYFFFSLLLV